MKCKNRKRCGFYRAFGYCCKALGENCTCYEPENEKKGDNMNDTLYITFKHKKKKDQHGIFGRYSSYIKALEKLNYLRETNDDFIYNIVDQDNNIIE